MTYERTKLYDLTIRSQLSQRDTRPRHYIRDQDKDQGSNPQDQDQDSENTVSRWDSVLRLPITGCSIYHFWFINCNLNNWSTVEIERRSIAAMQALRG